MNLHDLQTKLGIVLAGLAIVIAVGFFALKADEPSPLVGGPDIPQTPSTYTEVMPEESGELYRIHVRDAVGTETQVHIKFLDGSLGLLKLYPDGDTKEEVRLFLDNSVRKQAAYDAHGQVTEGFEYRANRTLVWKAFPKTKSQQTERRAIAAQIPLASHKSERCHDASRRCIFPHKWSFLGHCGQ